MFRSRPYKETCTPATRRKTKHNPKIKPYNPLPLSWLQIPHNKLASGDNMQSMWRLIDYAVYVSASLMRLKPKKDFLLYLMMDQHISRLNINEFSKRSSEKPELELLYDENGYKLEIGDWWTRLHGLLAYAYRSVPSFKSLTTLMASRSSLPKLRLQYLFSFKKSERIKSASFCLSPSVKPVWPKDQSFVDPSQRNADGTSNCSIT